jgi:hypothetical protein
MVEALWDFHKRWQAGDPLEAPLGPEWRERVSRRARVTELARLLEELA